jgi:predicted nucleic acid-binding protein
VYTVVLDANVLVPMPLCDALLRLAEVELYRPLWSATILVELERTLVNKLQMPTTKATRRVAKMQSAFPLACVDGYADLIPSLTNHPKDRHVLAAAIRGGADAIVTNNVKDFPASALTPYDIEAITADDFLCDQLTLDTDRTITALRTQLDAYRRPRLTIPEFYRALAATAPTFAAAAGPEHASRAGAQLHLGQPLPIETADKDQVLRAFFPEADPEDTTPLGAAYLWFGAINEGLWNAAAYLSANPAVWDYPQVAALLDGWSMAQHPVPSQDEPDAIVHFKLLPIDTAGRAFGDALLEDFMIITTVQVAPQRWRVWGVAHGHVPSAGAVRGTE